MNFDALFEFEIMSNERMLWYNIGICMAEFEVFIQENPFIFVSLIFEWNPDFLNVDSRKKIVTDIAQNNGTLNNELVWLHFVYIN